MEFEIFNFESCGIGLIIMNNRRERGGNTTWFQREAMLQWLAFKLMTGEATHGMKIVVAGARVNVNQVLALYVNQKCSTARM